MSTFVDTNVVVDVLTDSPHWYQWSSSRLASAGLRGPLIINDIVFAELSVRYEELEAVEAAVEGLSLEIEEIPRDAIFLAAQAFRRYRLMGGTRTGVLPDFFIGAHAAVMEWPLLTRDARRYRTYFPTVEIIAPEP